MEPLNTPLRGSIHKHNPWLPNFMEPLYTPFRVSIHNHILWSSNFIIIQGCCIQEPSHTPYTSSIHNHNLWLPILYNYFIPLSPTVFIIIIQYYPRLQNLMETFHTPVKGSIPIYYPWLLKHNQFILLLGLFFASITHGCQTTCSNSSKAILLTNQPNYLNFLDYLDCHAFNRQITIKYNILYHKCIKYQQKNSVFN